MNKILEGIVRSPITALVATAFALLFPLFSKEVHKWFVYIFNGFLLTYFLSLCIMMIISMKRRKLWREQMKFNAAYEKIEHDWQLNEKGDFFGRYMYVLKNIGNNPIQTLPYDDVAWHKKVDFPVFKTEIINNEGKNYKVLDTRGNYFEGFFSWDENTNEKSYLIFWHHTISPPLLPNDTITIIKTINTPETETSAFTDKGALAGMPINIPTKHALIRYVSPPNYVFEILDSIMVFDQSGKRHSQIESQTLPPSLNGARTIVTWDIKEPKIGYRYNYRYKLVKQN